MCRFDKENFPDFSAMTMLERGTIYTEYQPLISLAKGEIFGYEALARFEIDGIGIPPDIMFEYAHADLDLFWELEYAVKKLQFNNRPKDTTLFVNFDPHMLKVRHKVNDLFELLLDQEDFTLEIIENSHQSVNIEKMLELFGRCGIPLAIDDFLKNNSMLSLEVLESCRFLKLDKDILGAIKNNENFYPFIEGLVRYGSQSGKKVILEGIENEADLAIARELGVDFVQGFLYRNRFILAR